MGTDGETGHRSASGDPTSVSDTPKGASTPALVPSCDQRPGLRLYGNRQGAAAAMVEGDYLQPCSWVGDGKRRSAEQMWRDEKWCELLVELIM